MNALPFPTAESVAASAFSPDNNPAVNLMNEVGKKYTDALQASFQQTWMSSARIIQEHAAKVMTALTQESMAAMAEIAAQAQQRSYAQLLEANQQVASMFTSAFAQAMAGGSRPAAGQ
jgi:hypothetical protein